MRTDRTGLVIILAGILLAACQSDELLRRQASAGLNGGFEVTEAGIAVNRAFSPNPETDSTMRVSLDSTNVLEGDHSLRILARPGEKLPAIRSREVAVEPGRSYRLAVSFRNEGCRLQLNRIVQDASGMTNLRSDIILDTSASTPEWQTFAETLAVAEGEARLLLIFLIHGTGILWLDDVKLEPIAD